MEFQITEKLQYGFDKRYYLNLFLIVTREGYCQFTEFMTMKVHQPCRVNLATVIDSVLRYTGPCYPSMEIV